MNANIRRYVIEYLRVNIVSYFFISLIFIIGIVAGALAVKLLPPEQKTELIGYLHIFFHGFDAGTEHLGDLLSPVLLNHAKVILFMWLLGFTIIGLPFVLVILFTRGFIIGFTVGYLIHEYVVKGLLFALAAVLPHNLLAVPAVVITAVSATNFSLLLARRKTRNRVHIVYESLAYSGLCFGMLLLMMAAGVIEVYISPVFLRLVVGMLSG